jgi:hypothetical protein
MSVYRGACVMMLWKPGSVIRLRSWKGQAEHLTHPTQRLGLRCHASAARQPLPAASTRPPDRDAPSRTYLQQRL